LQASVLVPSCMERHRYMQCRTSATARRRLCAECADGSSSAHSGTKPVHAIHQPDCMIAGIPALPDGPCAVFHAGSLATALRCEPPG